MITLSKITVKISNAQTVNLMKIKIVLNHPERRQELETIKLEYSRDMATAFSVAKSQGVIAETLYIVSGTLAGFLMSSAKCFHAENLQEHDIINT